MRVNGVLISSWRNACFPPLHTLMVHSSSQLFSTHVPFFLHLSSLSWVIYVAFFGLFAKKKSFLEKLHHFLLCPFITQHFVCGDGYQDVSFTDLFVCVCVCLGVCVCFCLCVCVLGYWPSSTQVHSAVRLLCGSCFYPRGCRGDEGSGKTPKGQSSHSHPLLHTHFM